MTSRVDEPAVAPPAPGLDDALPQPRFRVPETAINVALILALAIPYAGVVVVSILQGRMAENVQFAIALVCLPALWWRWRFPLQVLGLLLVASLVSDPLAPAVLLVLYSVAAKMRPRVAVSCGAIVAAVGVASPAIRGGHLGGLGVGEVLSIVASVGAATALGLYVGARRAYVHALRERALDLQRERGLLAANAVAEERIRIARDLHDIVAHHVSLMVVQAGGLGETLPDDRSREIADTIASTGRSALTEMRRLLGVLRMGAADPSGELEPQQGIGDIEKLLAQTRAAGVRTEISVEGQPRPLPAGVDLSAYRITQEALTNVIRHAGAANVAVTVRYLPHAVELLIVDDGRGTVTAQSTGHGLLGMRERTALFKGELSAGPRPGGGFEVRAVLPIEGGRS
jgi:signal transduction histidine kinase